jgi:hypothetical protein
MTTPLIASNAVTAANCNVAHLLVAHDPQTASTRAIGPFASLAAATVHAYGTYRHLDDRDIVFLPLVSHRGEPVPAHRIHTANAIASSVPAASPPEEHAAWAVVTGYRRERSAFGPFASAAEAENWSDEYQEHLGLAPDFLPLYSTEGSALNGRTWAGILESLATVDIVLRVTVAEEDGMHFNDVNEPECHVCEYLPLIGFYGHACVDHYVEH